MGILLPPVPQTTGTPLTMHHRNRSLDSALQRIPEVDVTPSPECESNPTPSTMAVTSIKGHSREREDLASLGSDDSGILCGSESGASDTATNAATRESSVEHLHSRESLDSTRSQNEDSDCVDGDISVVSNSRVELVNSDRLSQEINDCVESSDDKGSINELDDGDCSTGDHFCKNESKQNRVTTCRHTLRINTVQNDLAGAAITLCCGTAQQDDKSVKRQQNSDTCRHETAQPKSSKGCLLRLFESQVFDMSMAISYLFNSKEPGVQSYLGKKMHISRGWREIPNNCAPNGHNSESKSTEKCIKILFRRTVIRNFESAPFFLSSISCFDRVKTTLYCFNDA